VLRAADGAAEVALATPAGLTNVIGSLHSSGLIALVDATGLAAISAGYDTESDFDGVVPLGASAALDCRALARGRLVASCQLDHAARLALQPVLARKEDRARISATADVVDPAGPLVCTFHGSIRRPPNPV
jgi:hypothetical protein